MHPVAVAGSGLTLSADMAGKRPARSAARACGWCLGAGCAESGVSARLGPVRPGSTCGVTASCGPDPCFFQGIPSRCGNPSRYPGPSGTGRPWHRPLCGIYAKASRPTGSPWRGTPTRPGWPGRAGLAPSGYLLRRGKAAGSRTSTDLFTRISTQAFTYPRAYLVMMPGRSAAGASPEPDRTARSADRAVGSGNGRRPSGGW